MNWAVDTNVLLRSTDVGNSAQSLAEGAIEKLRFGGDSLSLFPQNLIEFWAVATRPSANNGRGLSVAQAESQLIHLKSIFTLLDDKPEIFSEWERLVVQYRVTGKQSHDARLVAAMKVHGVSNLLTFNDNDFKRFEDIRVVNPKNVS
ncbi:MAG: PIN domain-containing protein [bacterium]